jgi:hypothetical protein
VVKIEGEIRKVITHDNCADGLMSALILQRCFPNATIQFVQHGSTEQAALVPEPGVLFCDFAPTRESAQAWADAGAYILDHHVHAQDIVALFGERGLFDNERCGALLAYEEVMRGGDFRFGRLSKLSDVRDRWQKDHSDWEAAQRMHRVLMSVHRDEWLTGDSLAMLLDEGIAEFGGAMARAEVRNAERIVDTQMSSHAVCGHRIGIAFCGGAMSSMVGEVARQRGYDASVCISVHYDGPDWRPKYVFSMRSAPAVDVGALCKYMDGGGHAQAAGFSAYEREVSSFGGPVPYVMACFNDWFEGVAW